jgi:hypothetical protein
LRISAVVARASLAKADDTKISASRSNLHLIVMTSRATIGYQSKQQQAHTSRDHNCIRALWRPPN